MKKWRYIVFLFLIFPFYGWSGKQCDYCAKKKKFKTGYVSFNYGLEFEVGTLEVDWESVNVGFGGNLSKVRNIGFFETGFISEGWSGGSLFFNYGYEFIKSKKFNVGVYGGPLLGASRVHVESFKEKTHRLAEEKEFGRSFMLSDSDEPRLDQGSTKLVDGLNLTFGGNAHIFVLTPLNRSQRFSLLVYAGLRYSTFVKEPSWNRDDLIGRVGFGVRWNF